MKSNKLQPTAIELADRPTIIFPDPISCICSILMSTNHPYNYFGREGTVIETQDFRATHEMIVEMIKKINDKIPVHLSLINSRGLNASTVPERAIVTPQGNINAEFLRSLFSTTRRDAFIHLNSPHIPTNQVIQQIERYIEYGTGTDWNLDFYNVRLFVPSPRVHVDSQNRPHSLTEASIAYEGGYSIYSVHGTIVPPEWILEKDKIHPSSALNQSNIDLRRAACEIVGWPKILSSLAAILIDRDPDPMIGELYEATLPDDRLFAPDLDRERFLKVLCGTGREFVIPVPPQMETALQANAWTYGLDETNLNPKPEIRT